MPNIVPALSGTLVRQPGSNLENQVLVNNGPGNAFLSNAAIGSAVYPTGVPFPAGSELRVFKNTQPIYAASGSLKAVTPPAVPASGTPQTNNNPYDVVVTLAGGTVTAVVVNGITLATATGGSFVVPATKSITLTYSAAPTWTWSAGQPANISLQVGAMPN